LPPQGESLTIERALAYDFEALDALTNLNSAESDPNLSNSSLFRLITDLNDEVQALAATIDEDGEAQRGQRAISSAKSLVGRNRVGLRKVVRSQLCSFRESLYRQRSLFEAGGTKISWKDETYFGDPRELLDRLFRNLGVGDPTPSAWMLTVFPQGCFDSFDHLLLQFTTSHRARARIFLTEAIAAVDFLI